MTLIQPFCVLLLISVIALHSADAGRRPAPNVSGRNLNSGTSPSVRTYTAVDAEGNSYELPPGVVPNQPSGSSSSGTSATSSSFNFSPINRSKRSTNSSTTTISNGSTTTISTTATAATAPNANNGSLTTSVLSSPATESSSASSANDTLSGRHLFFNRPTYYNRPNYPNYQPNYLNYQPNHPIYQPNHLAYPNQPNLPNPATHGNPSPVPNSYSEPSISSPIAPPIANPIQPSSNPLPSSSSFAPTPNSSPIAADQPSSMSSVPEQPPSIVSSSPTSIMPLSSQPSNSVLSTSSSSSPPNSPTPVSSSQPQPSTLNSSVALSPESPDDLFNYGDSVAKPDEDGIASPIAPPIRPSSGNNRNPNPSPSSNPSSVSNTALPQPSSPDVPISDETNSDNVGPYGNSYNPNLGSSSGYNPNTGNLYNPNLGSSTANPNVGGYNRPNLGSNSGYNPNLGNSYNPNGNSYNPNLGSSYNPNIGSYNPNLGPYNPNTRPYNPNVGPYNPNVGPYNPNIGSYNPNYGPYGNHGNYGNYGNYGNRYPYPNYNSNYYSNNINRNSPNEFGNLINRVRTHVRERLESLPSSISEDQTNPAESTDSQPDTEPALPPPPPLPPTTSDNQLPPNHPPVPLENSSASSSSSSDECICVPYYQCEEGKIITDGSGIIRPRTRDTVREEIPMGDKFEPPFCGEFHVCCSDPETSRVQPYVHRCGVRNPGGINRRVLTPNAKGEAEFGEWPWQATILKAEQNATFLFQCGGVLVDENHVLTVAHCVAPLQNQPLIVRLGEWDTQNTNEFLPHADYQVQSITVHDKFTANNLYNDIALLRLSKPVDFQPNIDTICLPKANEVFDGQECITTGWGKNSYDGGSYSNILKEVSVPVINFNQCQDALRKTRLGVRFRLHNSFMCAGGEQGKDSCKGDGGGPLVCYRKDGTYALAGLVAWGIDCGQPGVPGVYVRVQSFLDWIAQSTGKNLNNYFSTSNAN